MLDKKVLLQHIQNRQRTVEEQNSLIEGSRGFGRTQRVLGALEREAIKSGMNPETMYAKPGSEYAQRGRAFQLRQTDAGMGGTISPSAGVRIEPTEGEVDAGGQRRDPLRQHGSGRIGTVSRVYRSDTYQTPSQQAATKIKQEGEPDAEERVAAIGRTDAGIRNLSDKISGYRPEVAAADHQRQVANITNERKRRFPTVRDLTGMLRGRQI